LLTALLDLYPHGEGDHLQPDESLRPIHVSLEEYASNGPLYDMICFVSQPLAISCSRGRTTGFALKQTSYLLAVTLELRMTALRMKDGGKCENPTIQRLLSNMRLISTYNPESFKRKGSLLSFGQIVRFGILAIWLTINL
jgi:hypothetical protein